MHVRTAVAIAALLVACSQGGGHPSFYVRISGRLPPISGRPLSGGRIEPSKYQGKVVVINFWNPSCPPCRQEQPVLEEAWERLRGRIYMIGVVYTGGNWPSDREAAREHLRKFGVTYPNLLDASSRLPRAVGVRGIPTTVIADAAGRLRFEVLGRLRPGQIQTLVSLLRPAA